MHISEINIYPVKGLKGITLRSGVVEKRGLRNDRRWMLTDREGMFFTQRDIPKMATVTIDVCDTELRFTVGGKSLSVPLTPGGGVRQHVRVWDSVCEAEVYGDEVNEWFSDVLGRECQLVHMPETTERHVSERFDSGGDIVSFADGYPLLVIGEASLDELNERMVDSGGDRLPMDRFRPNIVVSDSEAFAEDDWTRIRIGEATFRVSKPCARCVVTTIDQTTGESTGKEPLRTLAKFRSAKQVYPERFESLGLSPTAVLFGQNLIPETTGGVIRVGDKVEVSEAF